MLRLKDVKNFFFFFANVTVSICICQKAFVSVLTPFSLCTSTLTSILPGVCIRKVVFLCCIVLNFPNFLFVKRVLSFLGWILSPAVCFQRYEHRNISPFSVLCFFGLME